MGCRLLIDPNYGACWFDSVTDTAFGPVFLDGEAQATDFGKWLDQHKDQIIWVNSKKWMHETEVDPRGVVNLKGLFDLYLEESIDDEGDWGALYG